MGEKKKIFYGLAFSLIFLAGCSAPNWFGQKSSQNRSTNIPTSTDSSTEEVVSSTIPLTVQWNVKKIKSLQLLPKQASTTIQFDHFDDQAKYYSAGTLTYHDKPAELIFLSAGVSNPGGPDRYFFIKQDEKLIVVGRESAELRDVNYQPGYPGDGFDRSKFTVDYEIEIPALHPPQMITESARQVLELKQVVDVSYNFSSFVPAFTNPVYGPISVSTRTFAYSIKFGPMVGLYAPKLDFYDKDNLVPQITYNNGVINTAEYAYTTIGGCGPVNFEAVVPKGVLDIQKDLTQIGKNNQGDPVYILTNTSSPRLKNLYEFSYYVSQNETKLTYEEFLALKPLLFWVDPFNNLVELQNMKFASQTECGKPATYLYLRQTTTTTV